MADIFNFPSRIEIETTKIESFFRNELRKFGYAIEMEDEIMTGIKDFLDAFCTSFNFRSDDAPSFSDDQLIFIKNTLHTFTSSILCDRLKIEIELYNLRHRNEF